MVMTGDDVMIEYSCRHHDEAFSHFLHWRSFWRSFFAHPSPSAAVFVHPSSAAAVATGIAAVAATTKEVMERETSTSRPWRAIWFTKTRHKPFKWSY